MRVLIVGDYRYDIYENSLEIGFLNFAVVDRFVIDNSRGLLRRYLNIFLLFKIGIRFVIFARKGKYDMTIFYRVNDLIPVMVRSQRKNLGKIFCIHNDRPYSDTRLFVNNLLFFGLVRLADVMLIYRRSDEVFYKKLCAKTILFPPYINASMFPKLELNERFFNEKRYDVIFVGHYEEDYRIDILDRLNRLDLKVGLYGDANWHKVSENRNWKFDSVGGVKNFSEYCDFLSQSWLSLGLVSSKNADTYTRRFLEIPMCGSVLLCERFDFPIAGFVAMENFLPYTLERFENSVLDYLNNKNLLIEVTKKGYILVSEQEGFSNVGAAKRLKNILC